MINLKNGKLVKIETDTKYIPGYCETCDYGAIRISKLNFKFVDENENDLEIDVNVIDEYEYVVSYGDLMSIITNNQSEIEMLNIEDFGEWIKKEIDCNFSYEKIEGYIKTILFEENQE